MRSVGQSVHRARLVQRAQSVRQRRIGGLLVTVRFQRRKVETKYQEFQSILSSVAAFQRVPITAGGEILRCRLHQAAIAARERMETARHHDAHLVAREGRLQHLQSLAERAVQRGIEREAVAVHGAQRVSESNDIIELQGQETGSVEGMDEDELTIGALPVEPIGGGSPSFRGEHLDGAREDVGWLACAASSLQVGTSRGAERRPPSPASRTHQPPPSNPATVVSEVVVEAPLPQSSGSVEIVHSPSQGVSVRVSTRGAGTAAAMRRSCNGMRDSLNQEGVRVSAIDVVEEDT